MLVNYSKTKKGALVEANILGLNPNRSGESIKVFFKKETDGKYTAELHSQKEHKWEKGEPTPWNEEQLIAMELYGVKVSPYNVGIYQWSYTNFEEAYEAKCKLIEVGKQLCKKKFKKDLVD
jgi:hypothetical protein